MVSPAARREAVHRIRDVFGVSERRACKLAGVSRSMVRYKSRRDDRALRARLCELAKKHPRFGYRRLYVLLRGKEKVNWKRVYRIYRDEGLAVRRKARKRVAQANRRPRQSVQHANEQWSMDFVHDTLATGRKFRTLNIIDDATRECLEIAADTSIGGHRVTRILDEVAAQGRPLPQRIVVDNGTEFTSRALNAWAYRHGVELHYTRPGRPMDNGLIESFNGKFRDECLNLHWFTSLRQARALIEAWRQGYNGARPHSSLGYRTPLEYAAALKAAEAACGRQEIQVAA